MIEDQLRMPSRSESVTSNGFRYAAPPAAFSHLLAKAGAACASAALAAVLQ